MQSGKIIRFVIIFAVTVTLASAAWADSLQLRDGRHFDGQYVGGTQGTVGFFTNGSVEYFSTQDVLLVVFGGGSNTNSINPLGQQAPMMKPMSKSGRHATARKNKVSSSKERKNSVDHATGLRLVRTKTSPLGS